MDLSIFFNMGVGLGMLLGMIISSIPEAIVVYYYHRELEKEKAKCHAFELQLAPGQGRSQPATSARAARGHVFCRNCRAQLQADSNFCDKCGKDARRPA